MAETVTIRNQAFRMDLFLSEIHRIPLDKWRKICKLIHSPENEEAEEFLDSWFLGAIQGAKVMADFKWAEYEELSRKGFLYKFELEEHRKSAAQAQRKPLQLNTRYNIFKGD